MKVSKIEEMENLDKTATKKYSISQEFLMENAGEAAYFVIKTRLGIENKNFMVLCGSGNNGGDGLVVARKIHSSGGNVKVSLLSEASKFKGSAQLNHKIASRMPLEVESFHSVENLEEELSRCDAVVDAIFGTGLTREVEGKYRDIIDLINKSGKTIFSIDIPSGINGDSGKIMGVAVRSDFTITYGLPKVGNLLYPGYEYGGKLYVSHISFPPSMYNQDSLQIATNDPVRLPERGKETHKGDFGDTLFIAGASSYLGAPYFSALSFLKAGGGYSRLASPSSITSFIANKGSEIVFVPQQDTETGSVALKNKSNLLEISQKVDIVVIGPGLSLNQETQQLVREITKETDKPLLVDGDGITALCQDLDVVKERKAPIILTPHLGEMSRISGVSISRIKEGRIDVLQDQARKLGAIIVLKGAHSQIGYPDGRVFINMSGNCGMASAGSGDVLTGTIAAMFGLGLNFEESVRMGVFMHGFSGDLAAQEKGKDGITAQDILDYLPYALKSYRENYEQIKENYKGMSVV
ncbi:NAD(P)H-hydrate dehydratase [bacterium]|nr:NAD(P)H-hydrate dehydratase [bacterium]